MKKWVVLLGLVVVGCEGPVGPAGEQGPQGEAGAQGPAGSDADATRAEEQIGQLAGRVDSLQAALDSLASVPQEKWIPEDVLALASFIDLSVGEGIGALFVGGGTIEGEQGRLVVEGSSFSYLGYSDGSMTATGVLAIDLLAQPITLKGTLSLSGGIESIVDVDMTLDASQDPVVFGGILLVDDLAYPYEALMASVEARR